MAPGSDPEKTAFKFGFGKRGYHEIMKEMESVMLRSAIAECSGNMAAAARMLKMDRSTMFRKVRELEKLGYSVSQTES